MASTSYLGLARAATASALPAAEGPPYTAPPMAPRATTSRGRKATAKDPEAPQPGIDAVLEELEHLVGDLEEGDLPLEEALAKFEAGVRLARRGGALLDSLEERVERLLEDRDEVVPFTEEEDDD